jgi:hypothetical protein
MKKCLNCFVLFIVFTSFAKAQTKSDEIMVRGHSRRIHSGMGQARWHKLGKSWPRMWIL